MRAYAACAIAYANAQAAYARIQHSLGQDFDLGDIDKSSVSALAERVGSTLAQAEKQLPTPLLAKAGARPKVQLFVDDQSSAKAILPGVIQALNRGGFEVVQAEQTGALKLKVTMTMSSVDRGLRQGRVELADAGDRRSGASSSAIYSVILPAEPREMTLNAVGEAAITANVGNLREWIASGSR